MLLIKISPVWAISGLYFWQSLPLTIKYFAFYPLLKMFFYLLDTQKNFSNNIFIFFEYKEQNTW